MKKVLAIMLIVVLSTGIFVTAFSTGKTLWEVYRPDYTVTFNGEVLNGNTEFPILECEGQTYLSLRDWGTLLDAPVAWDEEHEYASIDGIDSIYGRYLFNDDETALVIAKALCEDKFPTEISENTYYHPCATIVNEWYYVVPVFFNAEPNLLEDEEKLSSEYFDEHADVQIIITQRDHRILFLRKIDDQWVAV